MRQFFALLALVSALFIAVRPAAAVTVDIDLTKQRMHVTTNAGEKYDWPISSARSGYVTPPGHYKPYSLQRMHYSRKYDMAPMPYSIFFHGGYAIHGTTSISQLGRPASHGCIRLAPSNAKALFAMVQKEGAEIGIAGSPPRTPVYAKVQKPRPAVVAARQPGGALGYAPVRLAPSADVWMRRPAYQW